MHYFKEFVLLLFIIKLSLFWVSGNSFADSVKIIHKQQKRSLPLLFTNISVAQFVCGFGIPVEDLEYETITSGIVIKGQQYLPTSMQALRTHSTHNINARSSNRVMPNTADEFNENPYEESEVFFSYHRWTFYKFLETWANYYGYVGRACVLRSICEMAAIPFHYESGIIAEIAHILLLPSSTVDKLGSNRDKAYFEAELLGQSGASCAAHFPKCAKTILAQFSEIIE